MWYITKKDTFTGFILETLCLNAWRTDPDSATKRTKILEVVFLSSRKMDGGGTLTISREVLQVVFLSSRKMDGGGTLTISREGISDTQDVKERKGPISNRRTSTNQTTFDTIRDCTLGLFDMTIL